jgi:hypothetical protein
MPHKGTSGRPYKSTKAHPKPEMAPSSVSKPVRSNGMVAQKVKGPGIFEVSPGRKQVIPLRKPRKAMSKK